MNTTTNTNSKTNTQTAPETQSTVQRYIQIRNESSINWEGDLEPIRIVDNIFGTETAKTIRRRNAYYKLEDIWKRNLD